MNQPQTTKEWLEEYDVLDVVGNGMFGIIKKVKHKKTGDILARKELNFEKMTEKDRRQIVAEVNILKDLNHPNIVRYHDRHVDRENGYLYILMEYCGGGDLNKVLTKCKRLRTPLPEETVWRYFYQLLCALHHCHHPDQSAPTHGGSTPSSSPTDSPKRSHQILHRDLKPDNVFLTEDGKLKLGDFGLSKQIAVAAMTSTYVGTPYYMSPEVLHEKSYDNKSDIWSLGCLIYELCALSPPFYEAKTQQELVAMIKSGRIPPLPRGYSKNLDTVIRSMLNLNPGSRPTIPMLLSNSSIQAVASREEAQRIINEAREQKSLLQTQESQLRQREEEVRSAMRRLAADQAELQRAWTELQRSKETTAAELRREREAIVNEKKQLATEREAYDVERRSYIADKERDRLKFESEVQSYLADKQALEANAKEASAQWQLLRQQQAALAADKERRAKPFAEVQPERQNTAPLPTRYAFHDDTPTKIAFPTASRRTNDQNVPPVPALPSSKQVTPGSGRRLASKSNPNLGSAMKGVILTASGIALETPYNGLTHEIPPMPALPKLDLQGRMSLDSPDAAKVLTTSNEPGARLRRRSTVSNGSRPPVQHANTMPTGAPAPAPSIPTFNPAVLPPAPVYDLKDEANLPSPFMKAGADAKAAAVERRSGSAWSLKAFGRGKHGLLEAATSNAAAASGKSDPSSSNIAPVQKRQSTGKALRASSDALRAFAGSRRS